MQTRLRFPEDPGGDDHVLETDIMRFVAIIGIVFWIIFALVKSMPLHEGGAGTARAGQTNSSVPMGAENSSEKDAPQKSQGSNSTKGEEKDQGKERHEQPEKEKDRPEKRKEQPGKGGSKGRSKEPDLTIIFKTREGLLHLMRQKQIRVFGRAHAPGFDLIYEGRAVGSGVDFSSAAELPQSLWGIRKGEDRKWFESLLVASQPAVSRLPEREIYVSIENKDLEKSVEEEMSRLLQRGEYGEVAIDRSGGFEFIPAKPDSPEEDTGGKS